MFLVEEEADEMNADDESGKPSERPTTPYYAASKGQALARTCPFVARPCARDGVAGCLRTLRLIPKADVYFLKAVCTRQEGVNGLQRQAVDACRQGQTQLNLSMSHHSANPGLPRCSLFVARRSALQST
jgi:hypothetical protein